MNARSIHEIHTGFAHKYMHTHLLTFLYSVQSLVRDEHCLLFSGNMLYLLLSHPKQNGKMRKRKKIQPQTRTLSSMSASKKNPKLFQMWSWWDSSSCGNTCTTLRPTAAMPTSVKILQMATQRRQKFFNLQRVIQIPTGVQCVGHISGCQHK